MRTKIRVFILFAVFLLLVTLSSCVSQPDTKKSQPISVTPQYGKTILGYSPKAVILSIARTDGGKLPELTALLIDSAGKTVDSEKILGVGIVSSEDLLLQTESEGNYTIIVKNNLNETIYETNWTIIFPHYRVNESITMKNGIRIVFLPYQTGKSFQEKGVNYKIVIVPIEVKNIESLKEERVRIDARNLKVDRGYIYKLRYGYLDETLKPKEEVKKELAFDIAEDTEPIAMHGLLGDFELDTEFILELSK